MKKTFALILLFCCLEQCIQTTICAQTPPRLKVDRPSRKGMEYVYKSSMVDSTEYKYLYGDSSDIYLLIKIVSVVEVEANAKVIKVSSLGHEDIIEYTIRHFSKTVYTSSDGLEYTPVTIEYDTIFNPNDVITYDNVKKTMLKNQVALNDTIVRKTKNLFCESGFNNSDKFFGTSKSFRNIGEHWKVQSKELQTSFGFLFNNPSLKNIEATCFLDTVTIYDKSCFRIDYNLSLVNYDSSMPENYKSQFKQDSNTFDIVMKMFVPVSAGTHEVARQYSVNIFSHSKANLPDDNSALTDIFIRNKSTFQCAFLSN